MTGASRRRTCCSGGTPSRVKQPRKWFGRLRPQPTPSLQWNLSHCRRHSQFWVICSLHVAAGGG